MKNKFKIIVTFMVFLLVGCAADTHSSLTEEMLGNLNNLVSVLQSVQDSSSAQNAISQIEQSSITQISLCKFDLSRYETTPLYHEINEQPLITSLY